MFEKMYRIISLYVSIISKNIGNIKYIYIYNMITERYTYLASIRQDFKFNIWKAKNVKLYDIWKNIILKFLSHLKIF